MKKWVSLFLAFAMLFALSLPAFAADSEAQEAAQTLYDLGLFKGTGVDVSGNPIFDLYRAPTRAEAVTMLVRLLGKEDAALAGDWNTPFIDVADWAKPYVGYAYANGLTAGVSQTRFGSESSVTAAQFLTFTLRALGYESGKDFSWDSAWTLSDDIGLSEGRYDANAKRFTRGDAAIVSLAALRTQQKGGGKTLLRTISDRVDPAGLEVWQSREKEQATWEKQARSIRVSDYRIPQALGTQHLSFDRALELRYQPPQTIAREVKSLADLLQYMIAVRFGCTTDEAYTPWYDGWGYDAPGDAQLRRNKACCCGGYANVASYLLQGDYEKVGMIRWLGGGNHEINWVYQNGTYYVFDLTAYSCLGNYSDRNVSVWEYADLADFYDAMPERFPKSEITILVAFETDTASYPWGYEFDGVRQSLIFPEQTRGQVQVLHLEKNCAVDYRLLTADDPAVFDGSGLSVKSSVKSYVPQSYELVLCWDGGDVPPGWGFGVVRDGNTAAVYWNKRRLTDFTFTVQNPANCTVTKGVDGILTFTNVKDDTVLTITGPGGSSEFVIITK